MKFRDQKHICIVSCCQGLAESQGLCLIVRNRGHLRAEGREASPCWRTVLRGAAHISPQVPEHEEVSPQSVFVLPSELSLPSQQRHQQSSWYIICWIICICRKQKQHKLELNGSQRNMTAYEKWEYSKTLQHRDPLPTVKWDEFMMTKGNSLQELVRSSIFMELLKK